MDLEFVFDRKNEAEFAIKGEGHTFAKMLVDELLENEGVEVAQYNIPRSLTGNPTIYVKTKASATVRDALKKAAKELKKQTNEI